MLLEVSQGVKNENMWLTDITIILLGNIIVFQSFHMSFFHMSLKIEIIFLPLEADIALLSVIFTMNKCYMLDSITLSGRLLLTDQTTPESSVFILCQVLGQRPVWKRRELIANIFLTFCNVKPRAQGGSVILNFFA